MTDVRYGRGGGVRRVANLVSLAEAKREDARECRNAAAKSFSQAVPESYTLAGLSVRLGREANATELEAEADRCMAEARTLLSDLSGGDPATAWVTSRICPRRSGPSQIIPS